MLGLRGNSMIRKRTLTLMQHISQWPHGRICRKKKFDNELFNDLHRAMLDIKGVLHPMDVLMVVEI